MSQKRIDQILNIIKEQGYVTVKYLCDKLHYSTATINRDLNDLQKQKLIVRHYGGAELANQKIIPLTFRYHKMRPVKRLIAKTAVELIKDGMTIFVDGSTTTQYMGPYIKDIQNLTVITNNLNLASFLSESGTKCICLGGEIIEAPYMIGGNEAVKQAKTYTTDLAFFSTIGVSSDGRIFENDTYLDLRKTMVENSKTSVFLIDHKKIDCQDTRILCDFSEVDVVISDIDFPHKTQQKFVDTVFVRVKTPKTQE